MRQIEQLKLPLWDVLQEATLAPDEADLQGLLTLLDGTLLALDSVGQLQVAAEAIAQIVQVFQDRSLLAFEELEASHSDDGPIMPADAFDRYVRQTMDIDFEQFIEPLASLPRKSPDREVLSDETRDDAPDSVVGELDRVALLHALDEQMSQHPDLTEVEVFNQTLAIAHDEDVSAWNETIFQWMSERHISTISLVQLQQSIEMPLIQLWLALLLGGYWIEQRGEFYDIHQIWILGRD
jgi:hypothetical protein